MPLAPSALGDALARLARWYKDPGLAYPPDAGMSVLGAYGLRSDVVLYLLNHAPEILNMTPSQLRAGLPPERCPYCKSTMVLRVAPAEGRRPSRLVWRCYKDYSTHPPGKTPQVEMAPPRMARGELSLSRMLALTIDGATLDFQPNPLDGVPHAVIIAASKKRRRR